MTKLDQLIKDLCPNGVEYKKIKDICVRQKGTPITASEMKRIAKINGAVRVFAAGNTFVDTDYDDVSNVITVPSVIVKSRGNIGFEYYDKPFTHKNEMWSYSAKDTKINLKFLYHYLQNRADVFQKKAKTGKLPQISTPDTDNFTIPVPPLAVQNEIVRILDAFTELTAELTARKQQYEYYRDSLLTFDDSVPIVKLGDIAIVTKLAGFEFTKYVNYSNEGNIIALRGLNVKNGTLDLTDVKYIDNSDLSKLNRSKLHIGDMLFTYVGTIGQVALVDVENKYYLAPNVALIRSTSKQLLPEYMKYYFQSNIFWNTQINRLLQSSSMKNIPMEKIRKFEIPLPPLKEQERIVFILDRFDKLSNDISVGLPAEIKVRQQQYEYYRNKLLTFNEVKA